MMEDPRGLQAGPEAIRIRQLQPGGEWKIHSSRWKAVAEDPTG